MSWTLGILEVGVIPEIPLSAYLPDAPPGASVDPPCFCYVASDGTRTILIDTGPDRARCAESGLRIVGDTTALLREGLATWGVNPRDVELIVHTHLHYDHMGNDLLFPNASVAVQRAELAWATSPDRGPFYVAVEEVTAALGDRLRLLDGESELLPGVSVLPNGGHTPGHQSILIDAADVMACVCGDIVSLRQNLDVVGSVCPDVAATEAFLARARSSGWEMIPSHDPSLRWHSRFVRARPAGARRSPARAGDGSRP